MDKTTAQLTRANEVRNYAVIVKIRAELDQNIKSRETIVEKWAGKLQAAIKALDEPNQRLTDANTLVKLCESRIQLLESESHGNDLDKKIDAALRLDKYILELPSLRADVAGIESEIRVLAMERSKAQWQLEVEQNFVSQLEIAKEQPFTHPLAQQTQAYIGHRLPVIMPAVIALGDRDHAEWNVCEQFLGELLTAGKFAAEDFNLPTRDTIRRDTAKAWDEALGDHDRTTPFPSGQEIQHKERLFTETAADNQRARYVPPVKHPELEVPKVPTRFLRTP